MRLPRSHGGSNTYRLLLAAHAASGSARSSPAATVPHGERISGESSALALPLLALLITRSHQMTSREAVMTTPDLEADQLIEMLRGVLIGLVQREESDLSLRQLATFLICYQDEQPQELRGLVQALKINRTAIGRALERLETLKLLHCKRNPRDRRYALALRTSEGEAFFEYLKTITSLAFAGDGSARHLGLPESAMPSSATGDVPKKRPRGRPKAESTHLGIRIRAVQLARLDAWIETQGDPKLTRAAAIRKLIDIALGRSQKKRKDGITGRSD